MSDPKASAKKTTRTPMVFTREKQISIRLNDEEFERISRKAASEGLRVAQWLRRLAIINSEE
jgi:predicted DNA binding CopG/RHH family protein